MFASEHNEVSEAAVDWAQASNVWATLLVTQIQLSLRT